MAFNQVDSSGQVVTPWYELKGKNVIIVGGSDSECLQDIYITAQSMGVNIKRNWKYIYTASSCPI